MIPGPNTRVEKNKPSGPFQVVPRGEGTHMMWAKGPVPERMDGCHGGWGYPQGQPTFSLLQATWDTQVETKGQGLPDSPSTRPTPGSSKIMQRAENSGREEGGRPAPNTQLHSRQNPAPCILPGPRWTPPVWVSLERRYVGRLTSPCLGLHSSGGGKDPRALAVALVTACQAPMSLAHIHEWSRPSAPATPIP